MYTGSQPGGNMEGKEVRFGNPMTALFATVTTDASCGAVIGMHDSFTPIGGLVPLFNIQTDEVIFGGVGAGLYNVDLRCRRRLHWRIDGWAHARVCGQEQKEVKMAIIAILATSLVILGFTAISSIAPFAKNGYWNSPARLPLIRIMGPRTDSRKSSTRFRAAPAITAAPSPESTPTRLGTTCRLALICWLEGSYLLFRLWQ